MKKQEEKKRQSNKWRRLKWQVAWESNQVWLKDQSKNNERRKRASEAEKERSFLLSELFVLNSQIWIKICIDEITVYKQMLCRNSFSYSFVLALNSVFEFKIS